MFRADTPPTGKESPKTVPQHVPEGAVQVGWEHRSGPSLRDARSIDLQVHTRPSQNPYDGDQSQVSERYYTPQPQMVTVHSVPPVDNQAHHGEHFQMDIQTQPVGNQQAESVVAVGTGSNRPLDGNGSGNNAGTSQTVEKRRNRKKRPPNYYENLEKKNNTCGTASPPELPLDNRGGVISNIHDAPPPVNVISQHNFPQNVPMQNVPPEMVAQVVQANQLMFTNYLAAASVDPQLAQQQHQQQQMALATVNALIQQGMFPMQVPPPHIMPHMTGTNARPSTIAARYTNSTTLLLTDLW